LKLILSDSTVILNPCVEPALNAFAYTSPLNVPSTPSNVPVIVAEFIVAALMAAVPAVRVSALTSPANIELAKVLPER